ncbi:hypothetical protein [Roseburia sp. 499]|uniref:hypothetical protein n=1 Tax=Roseburia sp. 499 TaxID=1261634 RepID=UPI0009FA89F4|nr:hypothetical protein [Roseburia sp. 499]WVK71166.1 hypothetical protein BIV20_06405 [Roseburia sp. 499]
MRANRKISLLLCIFSLIFFCIGCGEGKFNGSMVGNENEFSLEYSVFNTTYEHNFNLEKGDVIRCSIVADKGSIDISIHKGEDVRAYQGNDVTTGNFDVEVEEAGEYTITVTGNEASGSVSFEILE